MDDLDIDTSPTGNTPKLAISLYSPDYNYR